MQDKSCASTAAESALARLRRHAGTASVAAGLVPLAAASAHAADYTVLFSQNAANVTDTWTFTNTSQSSGITQIEIPEISSGDINFLGPNAVLPSNWTVGEETSQELGGSGLKSGTAGAYIDLFTNSYTPINPGGSLSFTADVSSLTSINANFAAEFNGGSIEAVDPPIPAPVAAPEPATVAVLGAALAGLVGLRRGRKV